MLFYKSSIWWEEHLRGIGLDQLDATCWAVWQEGIETAYLTGSSGGPCSFHCLLPFTFVTFLIHCRLSLFGSNVYLCHSCFLFWTYIWNIQWSWSLCVCILCGLLSCDSCGLCKKCWLCLQTLTFLLMILEVKSLLGWRSVKPI